MAHKHHRHRTMRLRKHRRTAPSTTLTSSAPSAAITRARQASASDSDSSTHKQADDVQPEEKLAERHQAAEEARKLAKANSFLNSEVRHASIDAGSFQPVDSTIPTNLGSVTSEQGSYLARLSAQAEAESTLAKRKHRRGGDADDDDSDDEGRHHHHRPSAHGIVRRMAEKHHRKVEKRQRRRRTERLRRIAALDSLKEGEREHGQAKETTFVALIRKYGGIAQEDARKSKPSLVHQDSEVGEEDTVTPSSEGSSMDDEHSAYLVDTLDVVDPGVSAAGHLSNIGNSLIFPNIPGLYDRRPVIDLPAQQVDSNAATTEATLQLEEGRHPPLSSTSTSAQDQDDLHLDAYVHELLTKRQKFARAMQGVWAFLKTPVGVIAGTYGFLVVFGGAALVLFLVGAIDGGKNKDYWVEVWSQFENGLFTIPGVGLIPWRLRDTYRMGWIAYYQHLTWRLRKKQGLPKLADKNDLPSVAPSKHKKRNPAADSDSSDDEDSTTSPELASDAVLSPTQASHLHTLQTLFAESQSWYRPHETFTHHAFSISYALSITIFNDLNSLFQCLLCGYMWGYATHYRDRPAWSTGTFIPCSFLAGIVAAILIWKGGEKSKKKREVEEKLLAAFAKDIDAKVEEVRRETERRERERAGRVQMSLPLGKGAEGERVVQEEGLDLDRLAGEIAAGSGSGEKNTP